MLTAANISKDSGLERACRQLLKDIDANRGKAFSQQDLIDLYVPCVAIMGISSAFGLKLDADTSDAALEMVHQITRTLRLLGLQKNVYTPFPFLRFILPREYRLRKAEASDITMKSTTARLKLYNHALSVVQAKGLDSLDPSTLKYILSDPLRHGLSQKDSLAALSASLGGTTDTSSHTLAVTVACLAAYPAYQKEIRAYLKQAGISLDDISISALRSVRLLVAFLRESQRLHGIFHITQRRATSDLVVDGKRVRKGTCVVFDWYSINRDENIYGLDAGDFKPERFLSDPPQSLGNKYGHGSFGQGRRRCPGSDLAEFFMLFAIASMLLKFDIHFKEDGPLGAEALTMKQNGALFGQEHRALLYTPL